MFCCGMQYYIFSDYMKIKYVLFCIERWFNLKLGWMFINGQKADYWKDYLKRKYS